MSCTIPESILLIAFGINVIENILNILIFSTLDGTCDYFSRTITKWIYNVPIKDTDGMKKLKHLETDFFGYHEAKVESLE